MEENFNKHLGNKLKLRRLALGLTQTKVAKAINVTFQQIQKYEKGTNGVSSIRLLQLSNYLKVPINYFYEDFSDYLINLEKTKEGHVNVNYNFLLKLFSELTDEQKVKLNKNLSASFVIKGSFSSSFIASASVCAVPQKPTLMGPNLCWKKALTFLSIYINNSPKIAKRVRKIIPTIIISVIITAVPPIMELNDS